MLFLQVVADSCNGLHMQHYTEQNPLRWVIETDCGNARMTLSLQTGECNIRIKPLADGRKKIDLMTRMAMLHSEIFRRIATEQGNGVVESMRVALRVPRHSFGWTEAGYGCVRCGSTLSGVTRQDYTSIPWQESCSKPARLPASHSC